MLALAPARGAVTVTCRNPVVWDKKSVLFSACNEDTRSELVALGSLRDKSVFCVTAGGGRVLGLLVDRPKSVVAVDLNPAQNALLELKIEAMRHLDHAGYLRFLGARPDADRLGTYERMRRHLSVGAQNFFDRNITSVERGVLFEGRLERYLKRVAAVIRVMSALGLNSLLTAVDLETQCAILDRIDTKPFRWVVECLARRSMLELFSGDPGFFRYLPPELPLHRMIYDRIFGYLRRHLLRENALLQLVFFGRYVWEPALPVYLHSGTYESVKAALSEASIEIVTATVEETLEHAGPNRFDAYSLSDISSYLDDDAHHGLFERTLSTARPSATVCSRSNLHHRPLAEEHARRFLRSSDKERALSLDDHACVHEFLIGTIE